MFFGLRENRLRIAKMAKANKTTLVAVLTVLLIGTTAILLWSLVRGRRPNVLLDTVNAHDGSKEVSFAVNSTTSTTVNSFKNSVGKQNMTDDRLNSSLSTNASTGIEKKSSDDLPLPVLAKVAVVTLTCELKSCSSANKIFYDMAEKVINNQYQLSYIRGLKCKMGEFAAAEEKRNASTVSLPPCYYTSSESFLSSTNVKDVDKNPDALSIYLTIYKEVLSSMVPMSKTESEVSTRESLFDQLLSLEKTVKSLVFDLDNALKDLSACSCSQQNDKSASLKVYTQSYQQLAAKFSHNKSAFVTLKQLESIHTAMKRDLWTRQKKFVYIKSVAC